MKKITVCGVLAVTMAISTVLSGCSSTAPKRDPEEAVKKAVLDALKREPEDFSELLEKGMKETDKTYDYILSFPEELKEPYLNFLSEAYSRIAFQVSTVDDTEEGYQVRVTYEPLDLEKSLEEVNAAYTDTMTSADITQTVSALLEEDKKTLEDNITCLDKRALDFTVKEKDGSYTVSDEGLKKAVLKSMEGYMTPYEDVLNVLDIRDFFQAYLDATFKGEFTQFMKHTGRTQEEAQAWYESGGVFDPPDDLSQAYRDRCSAAYKNILKQCRYSIGMPKQNGPIMDFTVDVTIAPNNSLTAAWNEFRGGTYYDIDSVSAAYVESLEKYAAAPVYGEEKTIGVKVNAQSFRAEDETSDVYRLVDAICPVPE